MIIKNEFRNCMLLILRRRLLRDPANSYGGLAELELNMRITPAPPRYAPVIGAIKPSTGLNVTNDPNNQSHGSIDTTRGGCCSSLP